jgi:hypothetical protein
MIPIRKEWCEKKGFNWIDFSSFNEVEEYIFFLESKIEAINNSIHNENGIFYGKTIQGDLINSDSILQGIKSGKKRIYFKNPKFRGGWIECNPETVKFNLCNDNQ